jgi:hypothetical protein
MRKIQLFLALTLFSSQVSAEWELVQSDDESSLFMDKSTIRNQGLYIAMWSLIDFESPQKSSEGAFWSAKYLNLYNCRERTSGTKAFANYSEQMGLGKVIFSHSFESFEVDFSDVLPDSLGEAMLDAACGKK